MTASGTLQRIEYDAARYGFNKVRGPRAPGQSKVAWQIKCSKCPRDFRAYWGPDTSPDLMVRNMRQRQWDVGRGERPLCPDCAHPSKSKAPDQKPEHQSFDRHMPPVPKTALFNALFKAVQISEEEDPKVLVHAKSAGAAEMLKAALKQGAMVEARSVDPAKSTVAISVMAHAEREARKIETMKELEVATVAVETLREKKLRALEKARAVRSEKTKVRRAEREARAAERLRYRALIRATLKEKTIIRPNGSTGVTGSAWDDSKTVLTNVETTSMQPNKNDMTALQPQRPNPAPRITHAVFQSLDAHFDAQKRLYTGGFSDAKVAKQCGTTEDVVAWLRRETFGDLAEDPRVSNLRDDVELLRMEMTESIKSWHVRLAEIDSRLEQLTNNLAR